MTDVNTYQSRRRHQKPWPRVLSGLVCGALVVMPGPALADPDATAEIGTLSPSALMARYQVECLDRSARNAARDAGAAQARDHGTRCDALAEAIQSLDAETIRDGSADLARPDFYTPGRP
ncbi:hypothetical protein [Rhodospira trueperi]|uniref:UrcA family protein n=1 Tax=Rhodospira trueperi TaxID=69960 RepID=A0A1G6WU82_9PROT|nr:hypothetical protein [Rhodospira trueperi]SDD69349.1 hypothetical protein SAMN05421720_101269 [Rhodospira trueperi]